MNAKALYRINSKYIFMDTVIFTNAMTFLSITAVIPYFLIKLGANNVDISIANVLTSMGTLIPQIFIARWVSGMRYKSKMFTGVLVVQRVFFLIYIFTIPYFATHYPSTAVVMFLICWGVFSFFVGSYSPFYYGVMTKVIPYDKRGKLLGYAYSFGNISALLSSYILNVILNKFKFPMNYTYALGLGTVLLLLDAFVFFLIKEPPDEIISHGESVLKFFGEIPKVLKEDKRFRDAVLSFICIVITNISLSYYAVYATRNFNAKPSDIAIFTAIGIAAGVVMYIALGHISARIGHRMVLVMASVFGILAAANILLVHSILGAFVSYGLSTVCLSGYTLSSGILVSKFATQDKMSFYIAIFNTMTQLVSAVVFMISGPLIDKFGFSSIFIICLIFAIIALCQLLFKVKE